MKFYIKFGESLENVSDFKINFDIESKNIRIIKSRRSRNHWEQYFEKTFQEKLNKILHNLKSQKNFKKTFVNFKENFWKVWLTDCDNNEMWWNFNENLWKFYERENFLEILSKL